MMHDEPDFASPGASDYPAHDPFAVEGFDQFRPPTEDGRAGLSLAAGLVAALIGASVWAAVVLWANLEVGWVAWGVGALVGLAMSRVTVARGRGLALSAAGIAALALVLGKLLVLTGSAGPLSEEILADEDWLVGAYAWQLYEEGALESLTIDSIDAMIASGDTMSDALWETMRGEAGPRLADLDYEQRRAAARLTATTIIRNMGLFGGLAVMISAWDLLWFGLAIATAYRFMAPVEGVGAAEPEAEPSSV